MSPVAMEICKTGLELQVLEIWLIQAADVIWSGSKHAKNRCFLARHSCSSSS